MSAVHRPCSKRRAQSSHHPPPSSRRAHTPQVVLELLPAFFFFFVPCSFILVSRGFGRREVKEKGLQPWRRSLTPRLCPDAERWRVMGTPGGRPGLGEVNESDVGKTFASIIGVG